MSQHRILVVDDEAHIRQVLILKLRNAGYELLTAGDGEEGLQVAIRETPDLVISDFQMPYMSGLEMCKAMKSEPKTSGIPVIMLTARGYAIEPDDLAACNIREVLSKPFSPRSILQQVQSILDEADTDDAARRSAEAA